YEAQGAPSGPYTPSAPHRPPNPDTNPYLRLPDELRREGGGTRPEDRDRSGGAPPPGAAGPAQGPDVYGAPTVARPFTPPPRRPPQRPRSGSRDWPEPPPPPDDAPPPPPPPPRPRGR
ncbi:hypothetical protein FNH08_17030, partial [Streptomyces spongiae]|nr:hypothetical protein [Streptomyces spongiae]